MQVEFQVQREGFAKNAWFDVEDAVFRGINEAIAYISRCRKVDSINSYRVAELHKEVVYESIVVK